MTDRHFVDVHVLLVRGNELLLSQRRDDIAEFDGMWHLPSGKLESDESVLRAAVREADEEIGVRIRPEDLRHVHTAHITAPGRDPRLGLFFATHHWDGEPENREPAKCYRLAWFDLDDLPEDLIDYPATGIRGYRADLAFSTRGWPEW